ncbi:MAG: hypothetical protein Q9218_001540 [Villophora microphyllina]
MASHHAEAAQLPPVPLGNQHLAALQRDDLGTARRDHISTHDLPDRRFGNVTTQDLERHRRVNREGTRSIQESQRVAGWNSAWHKLANDEIIEEGLSDLNAGQSHRARLLDGIQQLKGGSALAAAQETLPRAGTSRSRGTGRGGRGGAQVARGPTRSARPRVPPSTSFNLPARVTLPSTPRQPQLSRVPHLGITVRLPSAPARLSTSNVTGGRRAGIQVGSFNLALPAQFMSHSFASNRKQASSRLGSEITEDEPQKDSEMVTVSSLSQEAATVDTRKGPETTTASHLTRETVSDRSQKGLETANRVSHSSQEPPDKGREKHIETPVRLKAVLTSDPQEVSRRQSRSSICVPETTSRTHPEPLMGTLLDEDTLRTEDNLNPRSYSNMDDLLGLSFDDIRPTSTSVRPGVNIAYITDSVATAAARPSARNLRATLTSYLPILTSEFPPEILASVEAVIAKLDGTPAEVHKRSGLLNPPIHQQTGSPDRLSRKHIPQRKVSIAQGSLAGAVQQNTVQWRERITEGSVPSAHTILGEYVVRTRFHHRHDSAESMNSMASVESALSYARGAHRSRGGTVSSRVTQLNKLSLQS